MRKWVIAKREFSSSNALSAKKSWRLDVIYQRIICIVQAFSHVCSVTWSFTYNFVFHTSHLLLKSLLGGVPFKIMSIGPLQIPECLCTYLLVTRFNSIREGTPQPSSLSLVSFTCALSRLLKPSLSLTLCLALLSQYYDEEQLSYHQTFERKTVHHGEHAPGDRGEVYNCVRSIGY